MFDLIPIEAILPNPEQPRREFAQASLEELADSIREHGVLQPILVERAGSAFILVDGERRWRAAKLAGLTEIPALVEEKAYNDTRSLLVKAMVANVQREDLNPIEEARAYQRMRMEFGMSQLEMSRKVGKSLARVHGRLKLLELEEPIQQLIGRGELYSDSNLARALLEIPRAEARVELARKLAQSGTNLRQSINAAMKVAAIAEERTNGSEPPMMRYARRKASADLPLPEWNMLYQLGRVPPWQMVADAALATCDGCGLRPVASEENCRQCPGVELLQIMLRQASTNGVGKR